MEHPGKTQNHRPIDNSIKEIVKLALGCSIHTAYSSLDQRYQQVDHAVKTWADLRQDLESLINNSARGTSRVPEYLVMQPRIFTDFIRDRRSDNSYHRRDDSRAPLEELSARSEPPQPSGYKRARDDDRYPSYYEVTNKQTRHEISAASSMSSTNNALLKTPLCPKCDNTTHCGAQYNSLTPRHISQRTTPPTTIYRSP